MRREEGNTSGDHEGEQEPPDSHECLFLQRVISDHKRGSCHRVLWYARPMCEIYQFIQSFSALDESEFYTFPKRCKSTPAYFEVCPRHTRFLSISAMFFARQRNLAILHSER
jgi:hypothetical protein